MNSDFLILDEDNMVGTAQLHVKAVEYLNRLTEDFSLLTALRYDFLTMLLWKKTVMVTEFTDFVTKKYEHLADPELTSKIENAVGLIEEYILVGGGRNANKKLPELKKPEAGDDLSFGNMAVVVRPYHGRLLMGELSEGKYRALSITEDAEVEGLVQLLTVPAFSVGTAVATDGVICKIKFPIPVVTKSNILITLDIPVEDVLVVVM